MPLGFAHLASYPISAMALSHSGEACACFLPPSGRSPSSACVTPASIRDDAARTRANLRPRLTARDRAPRPSAPAPSPLLPSAPCPPAGRPATFPDPLPPRSRLPWRHDQFANETTGSTGTVNQLIGKAVKAVLARLRLRPTSHVERHLTTPEPPAGSAGSSLEPSCHEPRWKFGSTVKIRGAQECLGAGDVHCHEERQGLQALSNPCDHATGCTRRTVVIPRGAHLAGPEYTRSPDVGARCRHLTH